MSETKVLKQSINNVQVVGTLLEMNLEEITKEVTLKGANGIEKKVECKQITKKEFKNPSILVEVQKKDEDGNVVNTTNVGVDFFPTAEKKLDDNGDIIDNPNFKAMKTVLTTYVPKIDCKDDTMIPTRVKVDGSLRENGYVDKNSFEWKAFPMVSGFKVTSTSVPNEDIADCEISGVIKSIIEETKGEDELTGRLKVELATFDSYGALIPFTFVVDKDLAEDFNDYYENGNSVKIYYEIITRQIGSAKKASSGGFGRRESKATNGWTITEYSIFRGDDPFEEENDYYVPIEKVKEALEAREIMKEKKIKEKKEDGGSSQKSSPKGASSKATSNPFGGSATTTKKANPFA